MSVIDDTRKLLQDLVAPDLKAIQVQLASMDKSMDTRDKSLEARLKALEATMLAQTKSLEGQVKILETTMLAQTKSLEGQIKSLEGKVDSNHASVLYFLDIEKRLEQLERLQKDAALVPRQQ